jgi:lipopolysaccharide transport system ATP-binding protein
MKARLFFAVVTAYQDEIYLIDELLSVGDEHFQTKCWTRMRRRLLHGASGVLVTHDWTAVLKLCREACVIEDGRISYRGPSDKAVVSYLKLPLLPASRARFGVALATEITVHAGVTTSISVPVEILEEIEVHCALSIEIMRIGIGWEIVILSEYMPVGSKTGSYMVEFTIPDLPLAPGTYSLNLFLRRPAGEQAAKEGLDCKSWTYGNGLTLVVEGDAQDAAVSLPHVARRIVREAA